MEAAETGLQLIVDTIPTMVWTASPDGNRDFINRRWLEYTGLSMEQGLGREFPAMQEDDQKAFLARWSEVMSTGEALNMEIRLRRFDGIYRWFLLRVVALKDANGAITKWYATTTDIHDREFSQLIDMLPQHIAIVSPDGKTGHANPASYAYFGHVGQPTPYEFMRLYVHPDDLERVLGLYRKGIASGEAVETEIRFRRHDGEYRWFVQQFLPLRNDEGEIIRWCAIRVDIHERKIAQEQIAKENLVLREEIDKTSMFEEIVGSSPALRQVLARLDKVAKTDSTVLITGETGTGKELIARAIHKRSGRSERAFVSVNCAAIPRDLVASELFGHEKGAFTGALQRRLGRFELAEGGTIFLDEVGELPAETQIMLLRVLQERQFERVGGNVLISADVRIIAATNRDLQALISGDTFRSDLYYRINVFPLQVPPLRERREDIGLLVEYFIDRYSSKTGKKITSISRKSLEHLKSYSWPGNIRELQNIVERSIIICDTEEFSVDESWLSNEVAPRRSISIDLESQEKKTIEEALASTNGRVSGPKGAAAKLGLPASTLDSKIKTLRIDKRSYARP